MFLDASESENEELWKQEKGQLYVPLMLDEFCSNHIIPTNLSLVPIEF
jgi:hypothetical protein